MAEATCSSQQNEKILPNPPSCSTRRDIKIQPPLPPFKGKWKNGSWLKVSIQDIKPTPAHILQDLSNTNIPSKWSWMETGGNKIENGSRDQRNCGCCWAFSLATVLGDRYALKYDIAAPKPSVTNLVSCGGPWVGNKAGMNIPAQAQCDCGGVTLYGGQWLEDNSIRNENCWSFDDTIAGDSIAPNCPDWESNCCVSCCGTDDSIPRFSAQKGSTKQLIARSGIDPRPDADMTINLIQREIMQYGPVTTSISVPDDLQDWWMIRRSNPSSKNLLSEDIYIPNRPPTDEGHAICITGWGEKNGIKYWEIRNSWGSPGFAYFAMSTSIDKRNWYGLDVPFYKDGGYQGGVVTLYAGNLVGDKSLYAPGKGGTPVVLPSDGNFFQKIQWKWIVIIGGILLALIILAVIL